MLSQADIRWIVDRIEETCHPHGVYMFGSYALGTAHAGSDLDLLVVVETDLPRHRRYTHMRRLLAQIAVDTDLVFVTPDEVERGLSDPMSIIHAIAPSARLLYRRADRSADNAVFTNRFGCGNAAG